LRFAGDPVVVDGAANVDRQRRAVDLDITHARGSLDGANIVLAVLYAASVVLLSIGEGWA
jgi:hypothetical protein